MAIQKKTYTIDEYQKFEVLPENADHLFELIDGEIVEKMASFTPSRIALRIGTFVNLFLMQNEIGYATAADGGYIMSDDNVLIPDVGYISKARLAEEPDREVPVPPDLAVEVKSPSDSKRALRQKAEKYLALGTQLVWLVFPEEKLVEVYMPDHDVILVGIDGILDGGSVLPGFKLAVKDIFPE